jgi:hypothetical protein
LMVLTNVLNGPPPPLVLVAAPHLQNNVDDGDDDNDDDEEEEEEVANAVVGWWVKSLEDSGVRFVAIGVLRGCLGSEVADPLEQQVMNNSNHGDIAATMIC